MLNSKPVARLKIHLLNTASPTNVSRYERSPDTLYSTLDNAVPLADTVLADRAAANVDRLDTIEGRLHATRFAADVIAARPPSTWLAGAIAIADHFSVAPQTAINEVLDAGNAWTEDPRGRARQRLAERLPDRAPTPPASPLESTQRWMALTASLTHVDVAADPHWPILADHLTRADATGYDVPNRLHVLLAHRSLPKQHALRDLDLRLIDDWPSSLPPVGPASQREQQTEYERVTTNRVHTGSHSTANQQLHPTTRAARNVSPTPPIINPEPTPAGAPASRPTPPRR